MFELVQLTGADLDLYREELAGVYRAAFTMPPYHESEVDVERFGKSLARHIRRKGFRCQIARENNQVLGFAYGYTGEPGGWWRDRVAAALSAGMTEKWLGDYFELAELAVSPSRQGEGVGGRLHDALLEGLPHRTAALSAYQADTPAMRLYQGRGWVPLITDFQFPGIAVPFVIMGLELRQAKETRHA